METIRSVLASAKRQLLKWLHSKKGNAFIIGALTLYLQERLQWPPNMVVAFVALVSTYILGQGLADNGKEKAKIEARANALAKTEATVAASRKANAGKKKTKKKVKKAKSRK